MAITTTPLGFQKPDGGEAIRNGDNVISFNADKAQEVIAAVRSRLAQAEATLAAGGGGTGGGGTLTQDPDNAGLYLIPGGSTVTADPDNAGLYLIA